MTPNALSRRSFLVMSAMLPLALRTQGATPIPVGLELYSVRNALKDDLAGTVTAVGKMGYQCVEFYAPYFDWTESQTKDVRKLLDDLGIRCYSTHNDSSYLGPEKISQTRDRNLILGCKYVVMASSHEKAGLDGWKNDAASLKSAAEKLEPSGLRAGSQNHQTNSPPAR